MSHLHLLVSEMLAKAKMLENAPVDVYKGVTRDQIASILAPIVDPKRVKVSMYPETSGIYVNYEAGQTSIFFVMHPKLRRTELEMLYLPSGEQGQGKAKKMFARLVPIAEKLGAANFLASAADIGRYAWTKFGFSAVDHNVVHDRFSSVLKIAPWLKNEYPTPTHMIDVASMNTVGFGNKFKVWIKTFFAAPLFSSHFRGPKGEFLLGKYVLLTQRGYKIVNPLVGRHKTILDKYLRESGISYVRLEDIMFWKKLFGKKMTKEDRKLMEMVESYDSGEDEDMIIRNLAAQTGGEAFAKTVIYDEAKVSEDVKQEMDKRLMEESKKRR